MVLFEGMFMHRANSSSIAVVIEVLCLCSRGHQES
jgi:hypothetical protein